MIVSRGNVEAVVLAFSIPGKLPCEVGGLTASPTDLYFAKSLFLQQRVCGHAWRPVSFRDMILSLRLNVRLREHYGQGDLEVNLPCGRRWRQRLRHELWLHLAPVLSVSH